MGEFIGFLQNQTIEGSTAEVADLAGQWRAARDRVNELTLSEAGIADTATITPIPDLLEPLAAELLASPVTRQNFGVSPTKVGMVELDKLVVHQKLINLTYANQLQSLLTEAPTAAELFRFAMPTDGRYDPVPNVGPINIGPHGPLMWAAVSPSTDFRVLNTMMLNPEQISGMKVNGRATQVFAVAVGYGTNLLAGIRVAGRLILRNGSHRAYALRAAGQTHVPMLIQEIPDDERAELLPPEVKLDESLYIAHPRPPLVSDYFDDRLHIVVQVPRNAKQVRVQLAYEESQALGV
jgi:hypothetical protein